MHILVETYLAAPTQKSFGEYLAAHPSRHPEHPPEKAWVVSSSRKSSPPEE